MKLAKKLNFQEVQDRLIKYWQNKKIYDFDDRCKRNENYVIDTPPPSISGTLHMGHVYSYTHTDFIARFQRMSGKNVFYPMGFDNNGLPTERMVEKKENIKSKDLSRNKFVELCHKVTIEEEEKCRSLFQNLGLSVDSKQEYRTISKDSQKISQLSFLDLVQKGQIYRKKQPVLWDPVDNTALSQADIEDKEKETYMNYVNFKHIDTNESLTIATTRPELIPACQAIFYHPEDSRYNHLKGKYAISPLFEVKVPILPDNEVKIDKGTGLVMCSTFGDTTDIDWWRKHDLGLKIIINKGGKISKIDFDNNCLNIKKAMSYMSIIEGKYVKDARKEIVDLLSENNLLVKKEKITHTVKCAERSGAPLEIITLDQWFVKTIEHKEELLKRSSQINWYPKSMKIKLDQWIESIAWDWCISRQRYFGVPFPVWYSKRKGEEGKAIFADINSLPIDPLNSQPNGYSKEEVEADPDVMDTWATSAVSPQLSSSAINENFKINYDTHKKLFPFNLRPQGHEILRTWAFYTILKSHLHENTLPWRDIMISGWCLAKDKTKMSKSKGNIIDPVNLLKEYGADIVRYWAAQSSLGSDTFFSEELLLNGKKLVNKIWNAAKFVNIHFETGIIKKTSIRNLVTEKIIYSSSDLWIISKFNKLIKIITKALENYEYSTAIKAVENFFWRDFCDNYLELIKTRVYDQNNEDNAAKNSASNTLYYIFEYILKIFAPFIPYVTDEIYCAIYEGNSVHEKGSWPCMDDIYQNEDLELKGDYIIQILDIIRKYKSEQELSIKAPIRKIEYILTGSYLNIDNSFIKDLMNVTNAENISSNINGSSKHKYKEGNLEVIIYN